jgi:hypothetical protein
MNGAIVELDALTDAVGAAAENNDARLVADFGLIRLVGPVQIGVTASNSAAQVSTCL